MVVAAVAIRIRRTKDSRWDAGFPATVPGALPIAAAVRRAIAAEVEIAVAAVMVGEVGAAIRPLSGVTLIQRNSVF